MPMSKIIPHGEKQCPYQVCPDCGSQDLVVLPTKGWVGIICNDCEWQIHAHPVGLVKDGKVR